MKPKILVLDDNIALLGLFNEVFAEEGVEVLLETNGASALNRIRTERPKVAFVDINLGNESGLDVLREAKKIDSRLAVIMMTGGHSTQSAIEAMKYGAYDYITKPFDFVKLKDM
ncbi:MAG: response regulator, partial [Desulfuromonadaceae bacterium]|nr:response regulator [Desulfuromonadaceae bacterium]